MGYLKIQTSKHFSGPFDVLPIDASTLSFTSFTRNGKTTSMLNFEISAHLAASKQYLSSLPKCMSYTIRNDKCVTITFPSVISSDEEIIVILRSDKNLNLSLQRDLTTHSFKVLTSRFSLLLTHDRSVDMIGISTDLYDRSIIDNLSKYFDRGKSDYLLFKDYNTDALLMFSNPFKQDYYFKMQLNN